MKNIFKIPLTTVSLLLCFALNTKFSYSQKKSERSNPIPEEVNLILRPFCYSCHGPDGGRLPRSKLNFAIWNGYSAVKQVEKAASICASMRKVTMPTKQWNQQNPGLILTGEQIDLVCNWAKSVRLEAEKKDHRVSKRKQTGI